MTGLTHLACGALIGLNWGKGEIFVSAFGSVLPDIDIATSFANKILKSRKTGTFHHRGILHTLFVPIVIYIVYWLVFRNNGILPFIAGYISHLLLDMFNPSGVPLFFPLFKRRIKMPVVVETGGIFDKALGYVFIALFLLCLIL